ncbi:MAG: L-aspartate oxidase [Clostridia bacterium]|nr:L-aspartate oxidase [Clostridia bacterium]
MKTDILIVGSGCAGLYCALCLPSDKSITIITKSDLESSDSFLAQGGICVLRDEEDYQSFFEDTLKAGHYENDRQSVEIMIRSSRKTIDDLIGYGVEFARCSDGSLDYTREGAHAKPRILYHADITGREITSKLLARVKECDHITLLPHTTCLDIIEEQGECRGAVIAHADGSIETVSCAYTVLATGGVGGLYRHSTNFPHLTGDALAIALRHGVALQDADYVQIHPTTFYTKEAGERSFLISESVRGEGAKLYNKHMERFVDELLPRDRLTEAIHRQMEKDGSDFVWEDLRPIPQEELETHFPNIVAYCREHGYDVTRECIPVVPAQHYFMGGVKVDHESRTDMPRLFAIGETACNGVHGKNRLASNSLLESLVFAARAANAIKEENGSIGALPEVDLSVYRDREALAAAYRDLVWNEIQRRRIEHV